MLNWRNVFMDIEVEDPSDALRHSNVAAIDVLLNLIMLILESGAIRAFVNILKAIFDRTKCCDRLNICMAVTLCAISLYHALIFLSLLPYLYNRTALPQSTGLTSAIAAISILSSLFP
jgi:hypothetical protein